MVLLTEGVPARFQKGAEPMSEHHAAIAWTRADHPDGNGSYSRNHLATLNGGQTVQVSAAVDYQGDGNCADPEQLLVTSVSSCYMLFFLAIADVKGYRVESYKDTPVGFLEKNEEGRLAVTRVELQPTIKFADGQTPEPAELQRLHAGAHRNCFIGNSLKTKVRLRTQSAAA